MAEYMSGKPSITSSEWQVMKVLWEKGPLGTAQIVAELKNVADWSRTTVLTLLRRLEKKGYVASDRSSRAYIYVTTISDIQAKRERINEFVQETFDGDVLAMLTLINDDKIIRKSDLVRLYNSRKKHNRDPDIEERAEKMRKRNK